MPAQKQWKIGAAGAVVHEGRLLLVRHTYGHQEGRWSIPGGFATHEERIDQTIVRELREELGLEAEVLDMIGLVTRHTERGGRLHVVFRMRPLSGEPIPDGLEVDRAGWFSVDEIEAMTEGKIVPMARNIGLAALKGDQGLMEDKRYPKRSETNRGFLVGRD